MSADDINDEIRAARPEVSPEAIASVRSRLFAEDRGEPPPWGRVTEKGTRGPGGEPWEASVRGLQVVGWNDSRADAVARLWRINDAVLANARSRLSGPLAELADALELPWEASDAEIAQAALDVVRARSATAEQHDDRGAHRTDQDRSEPPPGYSVPEPRLSADGYVGSWRFQVARKHRASRESAVSDAWAHRDAVVASALGERLASEHHPPPDDAEDWTAGRYVVVVDDEGYSHWSAWPEGEHRIPEGARWTEDGELMLANGTHVHSLVAVNGERLQRSAVTEAFPTPQRFCLDGSRVEPTEEEQARVAERIKRWAYEQLRPRLSDEDASALAWALNWQALPRTEPQLPDGARWYGETVVLADRSRVHVINDDDIGRSVRVKSRFGTGFIASPDEVAAAAAVLAKAERGE